MDERSEEITRGMIDVSGLTPYVVCPGMKFWLRGVYHDDTTRDGAETLFQIGISLVNFKAMREKMMG